MAKKPDFEAKDKKADMKAGVREGSPRDERMDKAAMKGRPAKGAMKKPAKR